MAEFDLDVLANLLPPVAVDELFLPFAKLGLGRPDHILSLALLKPFDVVGADHPAVHRPDPIGFAVALLHRLYDFFDGSHVDAVSLEDFVTNGETLSRDDQAHADLLAVRALVTAVSTFREGVSVGLAFEVRGGDIVEQEVVVEVEKVSEAVLQMNLELLFVLEQFVEPLV